MNHQNMADRCAFLHPVTIAIFAGNTPHPLCAALSRSCTGCRAHVLVRCKCNVPQVDCSYTPEQIGAGTVSIGELVQMAGERIVKRNAVKQAEGALLNGVKVER